MIVRSDTDSINQPQTADEWRALAQSQFEAGKACKDKSQALPCYQQAIASLGQILNFIPNFTPKDWNGIAHYQAYAGICANKPEQLAWYEKAIASLSHIHDLSAMEWLLLAECQHASGVLCETNSADKLAWFEKSIDSFKKTKELTPKSWGCLGIAQTNAGNLHKVMSELKNAQIYYLDALESFYHASEKKVDVNKHIADAYKGLAATCINGFSLDSFFYDFAKRIFSVNVDPDNDPDNLGRDFCKIHLAILNSPSRILPRVFLQFMRLMQASGDFLHHKTKDWLKNKKTLFKSAFEEMAALCKPLSLSEAIEQNFNMVIVGKLRKQEDEVRKLTKELQALQEMMTAQKIPEAATSVYAGNVATLFGDKGKKETEEEKDPTLNANNNLTH